MIFNLWGGVYLRGGHIARGGLLLIFVGREGNHIVEPSCFQNGFSPNLPGMASGLTPAILGWSCNQ